MKKKGVYPISICVIFCIIFLPTFSSPSLSTNVYKYHQVAMGTFIEITLLSDDEEPARKASLQAFQEIKWIEQLMSPWIERSDVFRVNRSAGQQWVKVSPETLEVIKRAQKISTLSDGAFDMTIAPLVDLWRKAREKGIPPSSEEVRRLLPLVNFRDLLVHSEGKVLLKRKGMAIDLGGIAKGYAVDRAFEMLMSLSFKNLIVNAGGDLRTGGTNNHKPWSIGIQHPRSNEKIMAKISVSDSAVATSGEHSVSKARGCRMFYRRSGRKNSSLAKPESKGCLHSLNAMLFKPFPFHQ